MSTVVDYGQRLFVDIRVVVDDSLQAKEDLFGFGPADVRMLRDLKAVVSKAVGLNLFFEELDIVFHFEEITKAFLFRVAVTVDSFNPADGRVVKVSYEKALPFVWAKVGHFGSLLFTEHCSVWC